METTASSVEWRGGPTHHAGIRDLMLRVTGILGLCGGWGGQNALVYESKRRRKYNRGGKVVLTREDR